MDITQTDEPQKVAAVLAKLESIDSDEGIPEDKKLIAKASCMVRLVSLLDPAYLTQKFEEDQELRGKISCCYIILSWDLEANGPTPYNTPSITLPQAT